MGNPLLKPAGSAPNALRHEGVPYSGPAALVPTASALLAQSLAAGAACLVAADGAKLQALRGALDAEPPDATFFDMSVHGRNPARVLPALQSFVASHSDRPVRVITEPVPAGVPAAVREESELNEAIFALPAYRGWRATVYCLYDVGALDRSVTESLEAGHRDDVPEGEARARVAERFAATLPPPPYEATRMSGDITTLGDLRRTLARFAAATGLPPERIDDLVYAVNEVVTNSICHGEGRARVLVWTDPTGVWCEVHDGGRIRDPLVGRIAPNPGQVSGRGLWLVNQLCDLAQVRSSSAGTFVRMFVELV